MSIEIETVFRGRIRSRGVIVAVLAKIAEAVRLYLRRRATYQALARLSDTELEDIGLTRTETGYRELNRGRFGTDL